jgi:tetratricopeptide (TPR) repeat protein
MPHFRQAIEVDPNQVQPYDALASAYAEMGRYQDAIAMIRKAIELAAVAENKNLLDSLREKLRRYESRQHAAETGKSKNR